MHTIMEGLNFLKETADLISYFGLTWKFGDLARAFRERWDSMYF